MGYITLTLKSDLCPGTGTGYSSFVDTDVSYDRYGLPYIPGRRIKGCLREAGEYIELDNELDNGTLERLFGKAGSDQPGLLSVQNGEIEDAADIRRYIEELRQDERPTQARVLSLFTSVRAMTAIDHATGIAQHDTLRFVRVVNRYKPSQDKEKSQELTFTFRVDGIDNDSEKDTIPADMKEEECCKKLLLSAVRALSAAIIDLHHGYLAVGGATAIGHGIFKIKKIDDGEAITPDTVGWEESLANHLVNLITQYYFPNTNEAGVKVS